MQTTLVRRMLMLFVLASTLMNSGCTSKLLRSAPEIQVVTKLKEISCNAEAMERCDSIAIEEIGNAFHGVEAYIQASVALDACMDKHAILLKCINDHNKGKKDEK
jgi:hypothetical protein